MAPPGLNAIKEILISLGASPSKRRSQNFLIDAAQVRKIASLILESGAGDIIEIGPGLGSLTGELLESGRTITALEIDRAFCSYLRGHFDNKSFTLLELDALKFLADAAAGLSEDFTRLNDPILCGNLPYSITTDLITSGMNVPSIRNAVFLTQLEFANRITSTQGNSFCIYLNNFGAWKKRFSVPASCFYPRPRVDSAVISFERRELLCDPLMLESVLRYSFHSRRKKLHNSWKLAAEAAAESPLEIELLLDAALEVGVNSQQRAEEISADQYFALANAVSDQRNKK